MQIVQRLLYWCIQGYRIGISPMIAPRCRYIPTCSQYALEAIQIHGAAKGGLLSLKRLCRCHPWGGYGYDPVPPRPVRYLSFLPYERQLCYVYYFNSYKVG